ncbi:MAG: Lsr2 family protein [Gordonia sp. (in: high G+C Gram-positive bacteria)]|uniref:histone-like nucleoid-structuring protein Lsr2 n=1 Tax=Gordonia sp. (in: high G+C Gram-positive bacteria) TaxID=84139 RepID=UPI003BB5BA74
MGRRTVIQMTDDIDNSDIEEFETVRWALDGKSYEFDTSPANAAAFRDLVATYVAVSRSVGGRGRKSAVRSTDTRAIRAWANENGFAVSDRGRIPADIIAAYEAAH